MQRITYFQITNASDNLLTYGCLKSWFKQNCGKHVIINKNKDVFNIKDVIIAGFHVRWVRGLWVVENTASDTGMVKLTLELLGEHYTALSKLYDISLIAE